MFYLFLFAHLLADFALQPLWLVRRKRYWSGLFIHVGIVLLCMLALMLIEPATRRLWPAILLISAIHLATDRWKVRSADRLFRPPFVPFLMDQAIHVTTLAMALSLSLPASQVWSLSASTLALPAIYLSAYLVAALATPIGLIVLFDPAFAHVTLSGAARTRSLIAAVVVLSLVLFTGPLALPLTLAGLALLLRRPASIHPLDTPAGILAVLLVAAGTGSILAAM